MAVCSRCSASLPSEARFCPACAAPVQLKHASSEERKVATVLFADLVGSTAMAGSQDPERTRALLDRFYDAMASEIEQVGGTVEKFVGDAVMAAFGAPAAQEDHAERALHAALAMRRRLGELFGEQLALRIGVNTGEVVVGRPREGSSFVTGDAVNVGARLEQAAAPGEILIGDRTAAAVRGAFELQGPRTVEAKGKPDGVVAHALIRAVSLMRPRGLSGLGSAFVGREEEMKRLRMAYERVAEEGEPHLVTVLGDPGLGKSRLLREMWAWLGDQSPLPLKRVGRCLSYGHGITYWPLAEVLREHFGLRDSDPPDVVAERLRDRPLLGLTLALDVAEGMHPLAARERLHDSWAEFLDDMVRERPAVLLIEDLHWAEDDLCDLLQGLVEQVAGPLLLITTARPELLDRRPVWGRSQRNRSNFLLEPIPPADAVRMLHELLRCELPDPIRDVIVERAEGNPFFVEELLATLVDRGLLQRRNGGWFCPELPRGFAVPDTVQSVLAARIDLLPPAEKAALQAASVIGRVFWTGPVYELMEGVAPDFELLAERDFIRRHPQSSIAGEREYSIKHALTRDVAYESLPKAKRARLHAGFAECLERTTPESDEYASLLAHHYAEAARPEDVDLAWPAQEERARHLAKRAVAWAKRAARGALDRYEIDEGLALLHQALGLEPDPSAQAKLWYEIGVANALKYDGVAFTTAMEKSIELGGPSAEVYIELGYQTVQRAGMWTRRPDRDLVNGWIDRAVELTDPNTAGRAKALASKALWNDEEAPAIEAFRIAEGLTDVDLRSNALAALCNARWAVGDFDEALEHAEKRLALLPQISNPDQRADILFMAVQIYVGAGRLRDAQQTVARLQEIVEGLTPHHRIHGIGLEVFVEAAAARWENIRGLTPQLERAVEANLATPCPLNVASLLYCALAGAECGDLGEATRLEAKADALGMQGYGVMADPPRLRLAIVRSDSTMLTRAMEAMDPEEFLPWAFAPRAAFLDALVFLGDRDRIEALAPDWLSPRTFVEPFALRALAVSRGDEEMLREAVRRFESMGLDRFSEDTRRRFLKH